jgi:hypothetical protein
MAAFWIQFFWIRMMPSRDMVINPTIKGNSFFINAKLLGFPLDWPYMPGLKVI